MTSFIIYLELANLVCVPGPWKSFFIGTSMRCSSRLAFERSTGNDVSGHYKHHYSWRERVAFQRSAFSSVATFSHRRSAWIKKLFSESCLEHPKTLGKTPFQDPIGHFGAPWRPFWILQVVRRCRRLASAPFAARLVFITLLNKFLC